MTRNRFKFTSRSCGMPSTEFFRDAAARRCLFWLPLLCCGVLLQTLGCFGTQTSARVLQGDQWEAGGVFGLFTPHTNNGNLVPLGELFVRVPAWQYLDIGAAISPLLIRGDAKIGVVQSEYFALAVIPGVAASIMGMELGGYITIAMDVSVREWASLFMGATSARRVGGSESHGTVGWEFAVETEFFPGLLLRSSLANPAVLGDEYYVVGVGLRYRRSSSRSAR